MEKTGAGISPGEKRHFLSIGETYAAVIAEPRYVAVAETEIRIQRKYLERYIADHPDFRDTLEPWEAGEDAPEIVRRMSKAASVFQLGPMAAVAGTLAGYALEAMRAAGAVHALVDNGGDIAIFIQRPVVVGLYTGDPASSGLGLRFQPTGEVTAVCTSSARVGPSLSLGKADAAVVIASDPSLADAAATALGNAVIDGSPENLSSALNGIFREGIIGALAVAEGSLAAVGEIPEICRADVDPELISKGQV